MLKNIIDERVDELRAECLEVLHHETENETVLISYTELNHPRVQSIILTHLPKSNGVALFGHVYFYEIEDGKVTAFSVDARPPKETDFENFTEILMRVLGEH